MTVMQIVLGDAVKLLALVLGLFYTGLVLSVYVTGGPHYQPQFHLAEPARSGERLLVWAGIKILDAMIHLFQSILNQLFTSAAEVGLWVVSKSGSKLQHEVRSHFL